MINSISELFSVLRKKGEDASSYSISFDKYSIDDICITGQYDGGLSPVSFKLEIDGGDIILSDDTLLFGFTVILRLSEDDPSFKLIADALNELKSISKYPIGRGNHIEEFRDLLPDGKSYKKSIYSPILISEVSKADKPEEDIKFIRKLVGELYSNSSSSITGVETQFNSLGEMRTKVYADISFKTGQEKLSFLYNYSGKVENLVDFPGEPHLEVCGDWIESKTTELLKVPLEDINRAYESYLGIS